MEAVGNAQTTDNVRSAAGGQDILSHGQSRMPTDDAENHIVTRTIADVHGQHGELYCHTDNHGCPRRTRRIILSHGQSRMLTDDAENHIITRTITDAHGRRGESYCHTDNRGCPRTTRRIILSHGQSRMSTDNYYMIEHPLI